MSPTPLDRFIQAHLGAEDGAELRDIVAALLESPGESADPGLTLIPDGPAASTGEPSVPLPRSLLDPAARYEDLGLLGEGGMGEVRRVRDRELNRVMAMKVIHADLMERPAVLARFIEEAQCSAQLQHPGIVPVHELGRLADGRVYFTMREVRGRTLGDVIGEVHDASPGLAWCPSPSGWTFRRLVDAFVKVCEAVGYAHARGVVHRDLKPTNVMLGDHGEVLVVDWGLAKVRDSRAVSERPGDLDRDVVVTDRSSGRLAVTRLGAIAGTPAYMAPEQAMGDTDSIDARTDVYALGAVLYEILSGRPPYDAPSASGVLQMVLSGPPGPPGRAGGQPCTETFTFVREALQEASSSGAGCGPPLPAELTETCLKAMARAPADRHEDAAGLASEVQSWLEGARRREQALEVVQRAATLGPEAAALDARALALRAEAVALLADVKPWEPEERKAVAWGKEDAATALERRVEALDLEAGQWLVGALQVDPTTPEAHAALAARHIAAHAAAEAARDERAVAREEALLCAHLDALPEMHAARRQGAAYLRGEGALTLVTEPAGAEVLLHRHVLHNRRLVPLFERSLGTTPLRAVPLAMGSYVCLLRHPGRGEVRYPVSIGRGEHWDGVAPGEHEPTPIRLPRSGGTPGHRYVPPGWFWSGGDAEAADGLPRRRLWCHGFVMRTFPVTHGEFLRFLNQLVAGGLESEALAWAPRERAGAHGEQGALSHARDERGRFVLVTDAEGDTWLADWPVFNVDLAGSVAYARWEGARTRRAWRLPGELEWEKAARGVDGRFLPWGDVLDPPWCCMRESHPGRPLPAPVDSFPVDVSVYGVRGLAGNVQDWCADLYQREGPDCPHGRVGVPDELRRVDPATSARQARRGGSWSGNARDARCSNRTGYEGSFRNANLGFRLARSLDASDDDDG